MRLKKRDPDIYLLKPVKVTHNLILSGKSGSFKPESNKLLGRALLERRLTEYPKTLIRRGLKPQIRKKTTETVTQTPNLDRELKKPRKRPGPPGHGGRTEDPRHGTTQEATPQVR